MECQTSNVTASVQSNHLLHGYLLPVFFTNDQLHRPPCCAKFSPCRNASATRPYCGLVGLLNTREKNEKDEKFVHLQGSAVTVFKCGGKGVTVCFLLT